MNEAFVNEAQLADWLTDLRLPRIRDRLPGLLDEAARQELSLRDLVVFLCRTELAGRRRSRALLRLKQARFPMVRELDDFDFEAQPSVNPDQLRDLGTARWVAHGENVLMPGPPGVGKTHLAIGLGRAAVQQDYSVRFVAAPVLVTTWCGAHRAEQWGRVSSKSGQAATAHHRRVRLPAGAGGRRPSAVPGHCRTLRTRPHPSDLESVAR